MSLSAHGARAEEARAPPTWARGEPGRLASSRHSSCEKVLRDRYSHGQASDLDSRVWLLSKEPFRGVSSGPRTFPVESCEISSCEISPNLGRGLRGRRSCSTEWRRRRVVAGVREPQRTTDLARHCDKYGPLPSRCHPDWDFRLRIL